MLVRERTKPLVLAAKGPALGRALCRVKPPPDHGASPTNDVPRVLDGKVQPMRPPAPPAETSASARQRTPTADDDDDDGESSSVRWPWRRRTCLPTPPLEHAESYQALGGDAPYLPLVPWPAVDRTVGAEELRLGARWPPHVSGRTAQHFLLDLGWHSLSSCLGQGQVGCLRGRNLSYRTLAISPRCSV